MPWNHHCGGGRWRRYFGPSVVVAYCVFVLVVIPVCTVEMVTHEAQILSRRVGWFVAGMLVIITLPISLWDIGFHMYHYTNPSLQRHIIRYRMQVWGWYLVGVEVFCLVGYCGWCLSMEYVQYVNY